MKSYFNEGETFTWVRDRDKEDSPLTLVLRMLQEVSRNKAKQALIAQEIHSGKKYFVKVIFSEGIEQVYVEKESKARLYSPFIIRIYGGMFDMENQRFITVMEYLDHPDLSDLVRNHGICGETYEARQEVCHRIALKFLYGIRAYMSLYDHDPMVHRDLKPENIIASPDGSVVKIIDFDWVHLHDSSVTYMERREQKGTPGYADPKYWNSYICRKQMDIYSAGLVLYYLYTGSHHFFGSEEINRYMVGDEYAYTLKDMPGVPKGIAAVVRKMIAVEEDRYPDIDPVISDLEQCLADMGKKPSVPERFGQEESGDLIRFSYRIGHVKYSPYVKNYRFLPILFGRKQERSKNGEASGHILSFYRVGNAMKAVILHEDCKVVSMADETKLTEGDTFSYGGVTIEVLQIRGGNG